MIWYLILLDILIYNYTNYKSFFFLVSVNLLKPNDYIKIALIGLFLDFIILNQFFINTISLLILFFLNKKVFPLKSRSFCYYLMSYIFNYLTYTLILSTYNQNFNLNTFSISLVINLIFVILSYNLFKKDIKFVRWL